MKTVGYVELRQKAATVSYWRWNGFPAMKNVEIHRERWNLQGACYAMWHHNNLPFTVNGDLKLSSSFHDSPKNRLWCIYELLHNVLVLFLSRYFCRSAHYTLLEQLLWNHRHSKWRQTIHYSHGIDDQESFPVVVSRRQLREGNFELTARIIAVAIVDLNYLTFGNQILPQTFWGRYYFLARESRWKSPDPLSQ